MFIVFVKLIVSTLQRIMMSFFDVFIETHQHDDKGGHKKGVLFFVCLKKTCILLFFKKAHHKIYVNEKLSNKKMQ